MKRPFAKVVGALRARAPKLAAALRSGDAQVSFSQCGEDLIVDFIFRAYLHRPLRTYLDIGAHHPTYLSNTYLFYLRGASGVLVEPDPSLGKHLRRKRPNDTLVEAGVGVSNENQADFYLLDPPTLNTFSKSEAEKYAAEGRRIVATIQRPLVQPNELYRRHFANGAPDFMTLDVEGLDVEILRGLDFSKTRPTVVCAETLTYSESMKETKINGIIDLMRSNDYSVYADTYVNTIFLDNKQRKR